MRVSVVVPVHNEAGTLPEIVRRLRAVPLDLEIIVVDDGSTDASGEVIARLPGVVALGHAPNRGKGAAVRAGLARATGEVVAIQDADLELDPEDLPRLVEPIARGEADAVYGSRFAAAGPRGRLPNYVANRLLTALTNRLYGTRLTDSATCYKVFRADLLPSLRLQAERFEIDPELTAELVRAGARFTERPVTYRPRTRREGKKIGWRDFGRAVATIVRYRPR